MQSQLAESSAYKPQVEAISPTLPVDNALENQIRHSRDELVQNIHRVDREITNMDHTIDKLKRKQVTCWTYFQSLNDTWSVLHNNSHLVTCSHTKFIVVCLLFSYDAKRNALCIFPSSFSMCHISIVSGLPIQVLYGDRKLWFGGQAFMTRVPPCQGHEKKG